MDAVMETSGMDTVQDSDKKQESGNTESEEKPKVAASVDEKQKEASKVEVKPKAAPPAPRPSASTADKPAAKAAAKPAVGTSAGARTKTVTSEPPPDPVNKM